MEKLNEFTLETKKELLEKMYKIYMNLNSINCFIGDNYNRKNIEIEFLHNNIHIIKNLIEVSCMNLKDNHTILNCDCGEVLNFNTY